MPIIVGTLILGSDQWTKWLIRQKLDAESAIDVIRGFVQLVLVENPGAAFGLFSDHDSSYRQMFLIVLSVLALAVLGWLLRGLRREDVLARFTVGLLGGGAYGNLIDRVAFGRVTDFVRIYYKTWEWPSFNVADSAITIGIILLLTDSMIFAPRRQRLRASATAAAERTTGNAS